ncbi:hypothetical protein D3C80_1333910 [compost metagenome]
MQRIGFTQLLGFIGLGSLLNSVAIRIGFLLHFRIILLLAAQNLFGLEIDFSLFPDKLYLHLLFNYALLRSGLLNGIRLIRFSLSRILIPLKRGDLHFLILLSLGDIRITQQLRLLSCFGSMRLLDSGITNRLSLGNFRISLNCSNSRLSKCIKIAMLVAQIFNCKRDNLQTHLFQILGRNALHLLSKFIPVTIDLFDGHRAQNSSQMTLQHLLGFPLQRFRRFAQKLLRRSSYVLYSTANLNNRYSVSHNRYTLLRINLWGGHIQLM